MARRTSANGSDMVHCDVCGEDYSATYKRCPFCEEDKRAQRQRRQEPEYDDYDDDYDDYDDEPTGRQSGGKRLLGGVRRRGGGYTDGPTPAAIIRTVLSLALVVAAIFIIVSGIRKLVDRGHVDPPVETPTPTPTSTIPAPTDTPEPSPVVTDDPGVTPPPSPSQIPSTQTAESFTLNYKEFTISNEYPAPITIKVTFFPKGSTGEITWNSSNPSAVTVDQNGKVTAIGKGTATITATMAGGYSQTCTVRSTYTGGSSVGGNPGGGTASADGSYTVVSGDTLSGIAARFNTTVAAIKSLNGLTSDNINIGQVLKLPTSGSTSSTTPPVASTTTPAPSSGKTHTVARGDTLSGIAAKYNTTVAKLMELNGLSNADNINIGQVLKLP